MKNQLDYKSLHALACVVKDQSFDRAAASMFITQSALSQRVKQLELTIGQPLIIRSTPPVATDVGKKLINHYYQVEQLERALKKDVFPASREKPLTVHLATNADSLATWLIPALSTTLKTNLVELNLLIFDEQYTLEKLKNGEVFGAITLEEKPIKGCDSSYLGELKYVLVASKEFKQVHFPQGVNTEALRRAPSAAYDHRDDMHINFIKKQYGLERGDYPLHSVGSSEAFVNLAKKSVAYCLVAELQIKDHLRTGELVDLIPEFRLVRKLYWQRWSLLKGVHQSISNAILEEGHTLLREH